MEGETTIDVQIRDALLGILSNMESRNEEIDETTGDIWNPSYPKDGSRASLGVGTTTLDFDAGTVMDYAGAVTAMSSSLRKRGKDFMMSVAMSVDQDCIVEFDNEDKMLLKAYQWYVAGSKEFRRIRITTTSTTTFACLASTSLDAGSLLGTEDNNKYGVVVRAASGDLTAGETITPITGLGIFSTAILRLDVTKITTPDGDDEVDFYIQTSYNEGDDWIDIECIHFATADNGNTAQKVCLISPPQSSAVARDETDGTLADDTKLDLPFGDRVRIVVKVTGATAPTYAYSCSAMFRV